ncbi:MAG: glycosyltransferase family 4 protein [Halieaceae bacterium]|jgi:glycosyltransferase involved in cell wall biosynthesis|nr:glycosyltransferase family 4 protein [Halieaceae bacterium]
MMPCKLPKVLMLSQQFPPVNYTGAPLQAWLLSRALVAAGARVEVITSKPWGQKQTGYGLAGVEINTIPYINLPGLRAVTRFISAAVHLRDLSRWDIVHGHALSPLVLGAALGNRRGEPPLLVKPSLGGDHAEGEVQRIKTSFAYPLFRRALANIDCYAVLDELIRQDLRNIGIPLNRMVSTNNGVDIDRYQPVGQEQKRAIRRRYNIGSSKVMLFCGQLSPRKGIAELLEAWPIQRSCELGVTLVICGDGPLRELVRRRACKAGSQVVYLGSHTDTTSIMQMSDVLILPSYFESFGNVVLEALACGVPVAATSCGIAPQLVKPGESGWQIAEVSVEGIGHAIDDVFKNIGDWEQMAESCTSIARQFSIDRIARDYLCLYEKLMASQTPASQGVT